MNTLTIFVLFIIVTAIPVYSAIISISATITSPPNYRNLIALRYGQLHRHNLIRSLHQAPRLRLSASLCHKAQLQAENMLKTGRASYSRQAALGKIGQNIYGAFSPATLRYKPHTASNYWYRHNENYDYATGKAINPNQKVWEFTSMVWKNVRKVGFGYAYGSGKIGGRDGTLIYIVAKYSPTPNVVGKFLQNVKAPLQKDKRKV